MMRHRLIRAVLGLLSLVSIARAQGGWQEYRDPSGAFTLKHPAGWTVQYQTAVHTILVMQSQFLFVALGGEANPEGLSSEDVLRQVQQQARGQMQVLATQRVSERPDVSSLAYEIRTPQGEVIEGRCMAAVDGGMRFCVLYLAPKAQLEQALPILCQIVASHRAQGLRIPPVMYGEGTQTPPDAAPGPERVPSPVPTTWSRLSRHQTPDGQVSVMIPEAWEVREFKGGFEAGDNAGAGALFASCWLKGAERGSERVITMFLKEFGAHSPVQAARVSQHEETAHAIDAASAGGTGLTHHSVEGVGIRFTTQEGVACRGYAILLLGWNDTGVCLATCLAVWAPEGRFDADALGLQRVAESLGFDGQEESSLGAAAALDLHLIRHGELEKEAEREPETRSPGARRFDELFPTAR